MLAISKLAARSISGSICCRSYGKIRELTSTIPGKMPKVCTAEEAVETVKSGDKVILKFGCYSIGVGPSWSLLSSRSSELSLRCSQL